MGTRRSFLETFPGAAAVWTAPFHHHRPTPTPVSGWSQLADAFNVQRFGAKGDGKTNDTPAFQRAVDAVRGAGGGTVYVPNGTFYLADVLTLDRLQDVGIIGEGWGSVLLAPDTANFSILNADRPSRLRVVGLRFKGRDNSGSVGVRVVEPTDLDVCGCFFEDGNSGIRVLAGTRIRICDNTVLSMTGAGTGVILAGEIQYGLIAGNFVDGAGEEGLTVDRAERPDRGPSFVSIVNNVVRRTGRAGIAVYRANQVTVTGNTVEGTGDGFPGIGVSTDGADVLNEEVAVVGNIVRGAGEDGIRIRDTRWFTVVGNSVRDTRSGDGIHLGGAGGASDGVVMANTVIDSGGDQEGNPNAGIRHRGGERVQIVGNSVSQARRPHTHGVLIHRDAVGDVVMANQAVAAALSGVCVEGKGCVVVGNIGAGGANSIQVLGAGAVMDANMSDDGAPVSVAPASRQAGQAVDGWYRDHVAAGLRAHALQRGPSLGTNGWVALGKGVLRKIAVHADRPCQKGELRIEVHVNGKPTGLAASLTVHAARYNNVAGEVSLQPGDVVDLRITTNAAWTPITTNIQAAIEIVSG